MALKGPAALARPRSKMNSTYECHVYLLTHHLPLQPRMNCDTRCLLLLHRLHSFISYSGPRGEISYRLPSFDTQRNSLASGRKFNDSNLAQLQQLKTLSNRCADKCAIIILLADHSRITSGIFVGPCHLLLGRALQFGRIVIQ